MLKLNSVFFDDMNPLWHLDESPVQHNIVILVIRGRLTYVLNGNTVPLEKGDLLYVPYRTLRAGVNDPEGPHQKYSIHFCINNPEQFPLSDPYSVLKLRTRSFDYLKQRFAVLSQQWFGRLPHFETVCHGIALELLGHFARESMTKGMSGAKLNLVKKVQEHLISHYREPVRVDELAEQLNRSPNYITQTYKEVTGLSPIAYLHHLRIQAAQDLMLSTPMTIGEVSDYLGFSDQSHFNRTFKKIMGYPPSAALQQGSPTINRKLL